MDINRCEPFIKWPGGKRWLVNKYGSIFPRDYKRLIEPFLGGAAVFFYLNPEKAILSDLNPELINLYRIMKEDYTALSVLMQEHQKKHSNDYFYLMRSQEFKDPIQAAARFLYLNRTCFNGMYRVNKKGKFNVPIGTKTNCTYDIERFKHYSLLLKNAELIVCDFSETIRKAQKGDLIFADPPYALSHNQSGFIKYNDSLFSWNDQKRLCECLSSAEKRGVRIISTNANNPNIKQMYISNGFYTTELEHSSTIAGKAEKRKKRSELLIVSNGLDIGGIKP